jgi:hypothetical protein
MRRVGALLLATSLPGPIFAVTADEKVRKMKVRIAVEGIVITGTLVDTAASRDFASLLPLTLTLKDYASTEKISDLPRRLTIRGSPAGIDPSAGDITYYSPWGNLALFYKDADYADGLVKLGTIDTGLEALNRPGSFKATISRIDES